MAWDSEANDLFPHTVTLTAPGSTNAYGRKAVGGTSVERSALIEYKMRMVRSGKGEETASSIAVYLSGAEGVLDITPEWSLQLPGETEAESRPVLSIARYADEEGDLIEVAYLQ